MGAREPPGARGGMFCADVINAMDSKKTKLAIRIITVIGSHHFSTLLLLLIILL